MRDFVFAMLGIVGMFVALFGVFAGSAFLIVFGIALGALCIWEWLW